MELSEMTPAQMAAHLVEQYSQYSSNYRSKDGVKTIGNSATRYNAMQAALIQVGHILQLDMINKIGRPNKMPEAIGCSEGMYWKEVETELQNLIDQ